MRLGILQCDGELSKLIQFCKQGILFSTILEILNIMAMVSSVVDSCLGRKLYYY